MATGGHESLPRHSRCSGTGAMMCPCLFASAGVFRKGRCPRRRGDAQEAICPAMGAPIRQGVRAMGPMYSEKANRPAITRDLRGMTVRGRAAPAREAVCPAMGMPTRQGVWEMSRLAEMPHRPAAPVVCGEGGNGSTLLPTGKLHAPSWGCPECPWHAEKPAGQPAVCREWRGGKCRAAHWEAACPIVGTPGMPLAR